MNLQTAISIKDIHDKDYCCLTLYSHKRWMKLQVLVTTSHDDPYND